MSCTVGSEVDASRLDTQAGAAGDCLFGPAHCLHNYGSFSFNIHSLACRSRFAFFSCCKCTRCELQPRIGVGLLATHLVLLPIHTRVLQLALDALLFLQVLTGVELRERCHGPKHGPFPHKLPRPHIEGALDHVPVPQCPPTSAVRHDTATRARAHTHIHTHTHTHSHTHSHTHTAHTPHRTHDLCGSLVAAAAGAGAAAGAPVKPAARAPASAFSASSAALSWGVPPMNCAGLSHCVAPVMRW